MSRVTIELNDDEVEELLRLVRDMSTSLAAQTEMLGILLDEHASKHDAH
tara:strand:- start:454 stop:600 length:147 start_codon:yes stop_codon:yes gene_type:complete